MLLLVATAGFPQTLPAMIVVMAPLNVHTLIVISYSTDSEDDLSSDSCYGNKNDDMSITEETRPSTNHPSKFMCQELMILQGQKG